MCLYAQIPNEYLTKTDNFLVLVSLIFRVLIDSMVIVTPRFICHVVRRLEWSNVPRLMLFTGTFKFGESVIRLYYLVMRVLKLVICSDMNVCI